MRQVLSVEFTMPFHVLTYPAPDLDGQWIAHCLELDLVAQGSSEPDARQALNESFEAVVTYNLEHGLVPIQLSAAPKEFWDAAGLEIPKEITVKWTIRATREPAPRPLDFAGEPLPPFETISVARAPEATL